MAPFGLRALLHARVQGNLENVLAIYDTSFRITLWQHACENKISEALFIDSLFISSRFVNGICS